MIDLTIVVQDDAKCGPFSGSSSTDGRKSDMSPPAILSVAIHQPDWGGVRADDALPDPQDAAEGTPRGQSPIACRQLPISARAGEL